jgi:hypothetical protein
MLQQLTNAVYTFAIQNQYICILTQQDIRPKIRTTANTIMNNQLTEPLALACDNRVL